MKPPGIFVHVALESQLSVEARHSSISIIIDIIGARMAHLAHSYQLYRCIATSPVQVTPSPLYPWLQAQMKLPIVLLHVALESQLFVPTTHSLTSIITLMKS